MPRHDGRRLLQVGRLACAAVALLALGTAAAYRWAPTWIDAVDAFLVARYVDADRARVAGAVALGQRDPDAAIAALTALDDAFADALPTEHRGQRWAEASAALCSLLRQRGRTEEAIALGKRRVAFAPQDLTAHLDLIDLLALRGGEERLQRLRELHALLPENPAVAWRFLADLGARGDHLGWGKAAAAHLRAQRRNLFRVVNEHPTIMVPWLLSEPFLPWVTDDLVLHGEVTLQAGTTLVRISLPPWIELHEPVLQLGGATLRPDAAAWGPPAADGILRTRDRSDASLAFALPAPQGPAAVARLRAGLHVVPLPFPGDLLQGTDADRALSALPDGDDRALLLRHRAAAAFAREVALFWSGTDESFARERSATGRARLGLTLRDGIPFCAEFAVGAACGGLRFHAPALAGLPFRILRVEALRGDGPPIVLPADPAAAAGRHDLEPDGALWRSTGGDPWLLLRLPQAVELTAVRVIGVLP
ncbi:MAG: hypothetical protein FJ265_12420 [Planctomycetes bacterium]|nr:hypothetical protein [Planctomycetota bacterium]